MSVKALLDSSIFKVKNTKMLNELTESKTTAAIQNMGGQIVNKLEQIDAKVSEQQKLLAHMNRTISNFLPAIQEILNQILAQSGVPNRFVILPVQQSLSGHFYKKYKLHFFCEAGHLVTESGFDIL
jgi:hypothetical protein